MPSPQSPKGDKKHNAATFSSRNTGKAKNPGSEERHHVSGADEEHFKDHHQHYDYVREYIDQAPGGKANIGYIVDRTGLRNLKMGAERCGSAPGDCRGFERITGAAYQIPRRGN